MYLLACPQAPAVRELKSKDRIEASTLSSIKLQFRISKLATIRSNHGASQVRDGRQSATSSEN